MNRNIAIIHFLRKILLSVLIISFLLAFFAAVISAGKHLLHSFTFSMLFAWLGWLVAMVFVVRWVDHSADKSERAFLSVVIVITIIIKLGLIFACRAYTLQADSSIFYTFVEHVGNNGISAHSFRMLSNWYDYGVWSRRSFPIYLPIRALFGSWDKVIIQYLNVMISTLTILMSYNLLRHALPRRAARIGIVLFACLPFNLWIVIDYYHHIHGTFYFVAALWLLAIILRAPRRTIMVFLASLFLGIVFICMGLQGGIDLMFFGIMCCLSGFNLLKTPAWRRGMRIVLFLFIIPLGMAVPITNYAKATLATFDEYKLDSGLKGFMARGWDIETGGEYSGRLEQIDRETPVDMKKSVLRAFVLSQIYYHPVESLIKLPFLKVAKFYLLGAASGIRESLYASGWPVRAHLFEGMRVGYTFPLLACATLGCCLLWNGRFGRTLEMLLLVVPVLTCFVFTFLGETSPRYSIYVHFSVMGLAGYGLSWFLQKERCVVPDIPYRKIVHWLGITLLLWLLFMGLMGAVVRKYCNHLVFLNLNTASTCDIDDCDKTPDPLRRTFVLGNELCARINNTTYFVSLSTKSQHATNGIFFLWPLDVTYAKEIYCTVEYNGDILLKQYIDDMWPIRCVSFSSKDGERDVDLEVSLAYTGANGCNVNKDICVLEWGYVLVQ